MNMLWLDVESTGLYADKHDIVQFACIPVINGVEQPSFNEFCKPINWGAIQQEAINVHGITVDQMKTFQTPAEMCEKLVQYLDSFGVQFTIAGFNVSFDRKFLSQFFIKQGRSADFLRLFALSTHDTYHRVKKIGKKELGTENLKLATLAKHYNIDIQAHDALSDIAATIEVDAEVASHLGEAKPIYLDAVKIQDVTLPEPAQLHCHSSYSGNALGSVKEWAAFCKEKKIPGFSICDHGLAVSFAEITKVEGGVPGVGLFINDGKDDYISVNAWATSTEGYYNLMYLASAGYEDRREVDGITVPVLTRSQMKNIKGVMFSLGDVYGTLGQMISNCQIAALEDAMTHILKIIPKSQLLVELVAIDIAYKFTDKIGFQPLDKTRINQDGNLGKAFNQQMNKIAKDHNLKCIPTSNAHFLHAEDKMIQDCVSKNSFKSQRHFHESYHVKTAQEMYSIFKSHLGDDMTEQRFISMVDITKKIVDGAKTIEINKEYHLPEIQIPDHIKAQQPDYGRQCFMYMMERIKEHGRWIDTPEYKKRFQTEIDVIMNNKVLSFIPYFLLYEDICSHARSVGVFMGEGRGSAGGSLISYYLKIIHIDPVAAKLPFERFLSHPRIEGGSFPDIDGDFSDRVPIIKFLNEKYGLGFAQVVTLQTMKVKNAIKDAMWALYARNRNDPEISAVCNTIPDSPPGGQEYNFLYGFTDKEGVQHKGQVEENEMLGNFFKHYPEIEKMVKKLIGSVRGYGRHASAYVVSTLDLSKQRIPTMIMDHDELGQITVTQFAAGNVEDAGLIKADILRVANLEMVKQAMVLIKDRTGKDYMIEDEIGMAEIYRLPDDDNVYRDFYNKKTDSVFQFHTEINKAHVQDFAPTSREHLAAMTALLRPGAMDAVVINEDLSEEDGISATQYYMDVRSGRRRVSYVHPDLAECTSNGVFVYQEEVMEFLVWAGFSMAEADQYRNAISKKKLEKMQSAFEKIRITCTERGWTPVQIQTVCNQIQAFARYSFNRSHSRCYGDLGYITMYLKHHHPKEWWCSVLNTTDKEDKRRSFVALLGDMVKPPSMKFPSNHFEIRGDHVVSPINVIKKIGMATADEMMSKGPFENLEDFCARINHAKVNIGHVSAMIRARAADDLMDDGIFVLNYGAAREDFMDRYIGARKKSKSKFKEDMHDYSPVKVFLDEREYNQCFNKSLFSDPDVKKVILSSDEAFEKTGNRGVPLFRHGKPVLGDLQIAAGMVANNVDREVGMVLLYQSSLVKKGVSKRTGKPYEFLTISLSDGYATVECVDWYNKKALGWKSDSLVYVTGILKEGWRNPVSIQIKNIRQLTKETE